MAPSGDERKTLTIQIRVTEDQRKALVAAAEASHLELSTWLRSLGLTEAERIASRA